MQRVFEGDRRKQEKLRDRHVAALTRSLEAEVEPTGRFETSTGVAEAAPANAPRAVLDRSLPEP
jgi:hypothetical protein